MRRDRHARQFARVLSPERRLCTGCEQYEKQPEKFLHPEFLMKMPVLGNSGDSARKKATPPDELQPLRGPVPIWVTFVERFGLRGQQFE